MNSALFYLAHWEPIDRDGEEKDMGAKKSLLVSVVTAVASVAVLVGSAYAGIPPDQNGVKVPEPGTLVLLSAGAGGALAWRWFRKRR